ncbi:protein of unknown function [Vibrio tapetis subsp. tapetis]|uniref:Uncharacterized protein n=1 Tax=Vibrio tapetis subsp. tapetis TaxID=1671868 RepID=A0A2N8ZF47_9VIBR|nr:protein of unknown function [Vibrio tapetis subsp. tapetis]
MGGFLFVFDFSFVTILAPIELGDKKEVEKEQVDCCHNVDDLLNEQPQ